MKHTVGCMKSHPIKFNHCFSLTVPMPGPPKSGKNTKGLWIKAIKKQHTRRSPAIHGLCCLMIIYKSTNLISTDLSEEENQTVPRSCGP